VARPECGYINEKGVRIVSVTEALSASRVRRWSGKPSAWARRAEIGSAVHKATAILDVNSLTWDAAPREWIEPYDAVSREVRAFCLSWEKLKRESDFVPRLIEHTLFAKSGVINFATTLDRIGLLAGAPAIIELKTPKVVEPYWGPQLAGQEEALMQTFGPPTIRPFKYTRWAAQLFSNGKCGRLVPFTDLNDRNVFLWSLGIAVWTRNNYGISE
jgi:hypothetical protein